MCEMQKRRKTWPQRHSSKTALSLDVHCATAQHQVKILSTFSTNELPLQAMTVIPIMSHLSQLLPPPRLLAIQTCGT